MDLSEELQKVLFGEVLDGLPYFCLERWQSLHENIARVVLSESGIHPLKLIELEEYGVDINSILSLDIGYGWTRGSPELRERISELYREVVKPDNILVTNGSAEANFITVLSVISSNDVVLVDVPNYMQIPGLLEWVNAKAIYLWREPPDWRFSIDKAIEYMRSYRPKAIFVNDPNNPTGSYMKREELRELAEEAEKIGAILIFDEVYWGSERNEPKNSIAEVANSEGFISVSGLSKVYGLPGLRIGWIATGLSRYVDRMLGLKDYTTIAPSILSDYIASKILTRRNIERLRDRARKIVEKNLEILMEKLYKRDIIEVNKPSAGAYIWVKVPWTNNTLPLSYTLYRKYSVLVIPGECFEYRGYLRIGIGQKPDIFTNNIEYLLNSLEDIKKKSNH
uniref:Aminotransferase n=1 Tax=Ignisphaera aggregans TaxID=334771 RepID=A0A7J3QGB0_9CREN